MHELPNVVSNLRKLRFRPDVRGNRTLARDGSDFYTNAVWQAGTFFCNGKRFIQRRDVEKEITADCFLGFGERTIGDDTVLTRDDFPFAFQWISGYRFAFLG